MAEPDEIERGKTYVSASLRCNVETLAVAADRVTWTVKTAQGVITAVACYDLSTPD